jgi:hypothetical protein
MRRESPAEADTPETQAHFETVGQHLLGLDAHTTFL